MNNRDRLIIPISVFVLLFTLATLIVVATSL